METNRRPLRSRNTRWAQALSRSLAERRISPNAISSAGMVFASIGAICFCLTLHTARWQALLLIGAAAAVQLRLICNLLDGLVAVEGGLQGRGGALFNEAPDRYEDLILLAAAGAAVGSPALGWMAATFAVLTAYVRAFGASLGLAQDFCGPFAKQQRMFFLTVGALAAIVYRPALEGALWLIAFGALFTAVRRVVRIYQQLS